MRLFELCKLKLKSLFSYIDLCGEKLLHVNFANYSLITVLDLYRWNLSVSQVIVWIILRIDRATLSLDHKAWANSVTGLVSLFVFFNSKHWQVTLIASRGDYIVEESENDLISLNVKMLHLAAHKDFIQDDSGSLWQLIIIDAQPRQRHGWLVWNFLLNSWEDNAPRIICELVWVKFNCSQARIHAYGLRKSLEYDEILWSSQVTLVYEEFFQEVTRDYEAYDV
jgi:hypothetical protein